MKVLIQRVKKASVTIDNKLYSEIESGILALVGIEKGDSTEQVEKLAKKIVNLRIFPDENDKMNLSLKDVAGEVLVVSQFTLYGDCRKGKRPSFIAAARPGTAIPLYERFVAELMDHDLHVETGWFGADMEVSLINDGPVTLILDTEEMRTGRVDR